MTLTSKPDPYFNSDQARFAFRVTDKGSGVDEIECRLDGESFKTCESPVNYNNLSDGDHSFSVKARDKAGNVSLTQSYQWFVDTTGPEILFVVKPDDFVYIGSNAKVQFILNDRRGSGVEKYRCFFNGRAQACNSEGLYNFPMTRYGHNSFQVRAFDKLGNGTTKTLSWTSQYELVSKQKEFKVQVDRPVDVLFVVDNSRSMDEEREHLARRIDGFLHKLKGLDWQVAVISTEIYGKGDNNDEYHQDGRLIPFDTEGKTGFLTPKWMWI